MRFTPAPLPGVHLIYSNRIGEERGAIARLFCRDAFSEAGIPMQIARVETTRAFARGNLQGLRFQLPPAAEIKVVRCTAGALWSVVVDLRPDSLTFRRWFGIELSAGNRIGMVVPRGCAHGFVTLVEATDALLLSSAAHSPRAERGLRWNDPAIGIGWPLAPTELSAEEASWPPLDAVANDLRLMRALL